jgi:hypothetical protein
MSGKKRNKITVKPTEHKIRGFKIQLRKREILRTLKYDSRYSEIDRNVEELIQEQIENAYELIFPSVVYNTFHKDLENYKEIKESIMHGSQQLKDYLKKARAFTLMAACLMLSVPKPRNNP